MRGIYRRSRPEVLCRKDAPRNPTKPTGKHPGLRPVTLLKMETPAQAPSRKPRKIPKNIPPDRTPPVAASKLKQINNDLMKKVYEKQEKFIDFNQITRKTK